MPKHGLIIALGIGKKKPGEAPPSYRGDPDAGEPGEASETMEPGPDDKVGPADIRPEEVSYSDNDLCETCANMGQDGNCARYGFPVDKTGHCADGYEPAGGGGMEQESTPAAMGMQP
jgi:hypothetical protein